MAGAARHPGARADWGGLGRCALVLVAFAAAAAPARGERQGASAPDAFRRDLDAFAPQQVQGGKRGVEDENPRVTLDGRLSSEDHPRELGHPLTHRWVTTDFANWQLELITRPLCTNDEVMSELLALHIFVARHLPPDELLWAGSMPGLLGPRGSVPIAQYGNSYLGLVKTLYRLGLLQRYGDLMQAISGVHFNYSPPAAFWKALASLRGVAAADRHFISEQYFGLLRNYRRVAWLTTYLFGASPAIDRSFLAGAPAPDYLEEGVDGTLFGPFATSLRQSGELGYAIKGRRGATVSLNSMERYLDQLAKALRTPNPDYRRDGGGPLTTAFLQQEAELYGVARPKRTPESGERVWEALRQRGVEYVELRNLDRDPFRPTAVDPHAPYLLEALALASALHDSPPITKREEDAIAFNHKTVASQGRKPGLKLQRDGRDVELRAWAQELLDELGQVAKLLDEGHAGKPYAAALAAQQAKLDTPALLPSARLVQPLRDGQSFVRHTLALSATNTQRLLARAATPDPAILPALEQEVQRSFAAEAALRRQDAASGLSFERYVVDYLNRTGTPPADWLIKAVASEGRRAGQRPVQIGHRVSPAR